MWGGSGSPVIAVIPRIRALGPVCLKAKGPDAPPSLPSASEAATAISVRSDDCHY